MAIALFDENTTHDGTQFVPFDDSRSSAVRRAASESSTTANVRTDTREIDQYRQGVEITTEAYRYLGAGPKIWSGNIKGYSQVRTLGQALSFTEYSNTKVWKETPTFNPVSYIRLGSRYPSPIIFNEGPQQNLEANVQPLTIPFRDGLQTNEFENAHAFRGNVEDGNPDYRFLKGSNSRIIQFIDMKESNDFLPFLDEGAMHYGSTLSSSILVPGFQSEGVEGYISPYDDVGTENILLYLSTSNSEFLSVLRTSCSFDLDEDIRGEYGYKSCAAGYDVYGPNQGRYGTDSIAFIGSFRGS